MKQVYTLSILSLFIFSCGVRINYLGSESMPTTDVDVYVDASAIKKPYTIVGKGFPDYLMYSRINNSTEKLQQKAMEIARKKGANAILFQDYYLQQNGVNISSVSTTDSVGKGVVSTSNSSITPVVATGRNILFLKYN